MAAVIGYGLLLGWIVWMGLIPLAADLPVGQMAATVQLAYLAEPPAQLIVALKSRTAAEVGLPDDQIILQQVETVDWSDSCLELAGANEFCAQAITPGYRVVLRAQSQTRTYHTNRSGTLVRLLESN